MGGSGTLKKLGQGSLKGWLKNFLLRITTFLLKEGLNRGLKGLNFPRYFRNWHGLELRRFWKKEYFLRFFKTLGEKLVPDFVGIKGNSWVGWAPLKFGLSTFS